MIVPAANAAEASLAQSTRLLSARTLNEVIDHLANDSPLPMASSRPLPPTQHDTPRLSDIKGQAAAKRALLIAASGGHNLLMIGPPGTGKTMLASRLRSLLPDMTLDEALEVASIASVSRQAFDTGRFRERPFRSPHHTATGAAMVGGNSPPRPGEISLAHAGVLFLDELPEYSRQALEALREPLESGEIWISRAAGQVRYPAGFQLVAAMNPCPCGHFGNRLQECECTADQIHRYRSRLSGPLLDRIDLHIEVPPLPPGTLSGGTSRTEDLQCERSHPDMTSVEDDTWQQNRVETTRQRSLARQGTLNVKLDGRQLTRHCRLVDEDSHYLDHAVSSLGISARGYFKILRIARTIADLSDGADINRTHLIEALGFRRLDRLR
jgi:magnesium chelatase family protein